MSPLYTIGHSTHPAERVVELLQQHEITAVGDVRSRPYSRWNPQFNREALKQVLADNGIAYVFLGKELGGRPEDPSFCHRALLIGREAEQRGWTMRHILADGGLETQDETMARVR